MLRAPGIRTLVMTMVPVGFAIGALEVAVPAFSHDESRAELAGVLLATWSLGSAIGGFVYGARVRRSPLPLVHQRLTLLLPLGFLPLLIAPTMAVMALLLVPAGLFIAPILATRNELASQAAPPGTKTEALTWPLTALVGGIALGAAAGGALIDASGLACGGDRSRGERVCRGTCGDLAPFLAAGRGRLGLTSRRTIVTRAMAKRKRRERERTPAPTSEYRDAEGNVLTLRDTVSAGTVAKLRESVGGAASSADDIWRRRTEMLFERFAVGWTIAGLPLDGQKELLGRYRLADEATQRWVRQTIDEHLRRHHPEVLR